MPFTDISADQVVDGSFSGAYIIDGSMVVGNAAGRHVVIGSDAQGADGVRLYDVDGVTPLIDITIAGTPTITSAVVRTAAAGPRIVMDGPSDTLTAYGAGGQFIRLTPSGVTTTEIDFSTADPLEIVTGQLYQSIAGVGVTRQAAVALVSPGLYSGAGPGPYRALVEATSGSVDLSQPATVTLEAGANIDLVWDGTTLGGGVGNNIGFELGNSGGVGKLVWDGATLTGPGIVNLGAGATVVGGTVNVRNPAAAPVGRHTLTLELAAGQTGNVVRVVDATNSNVIAVITASGRVVAQNTDAFVAGTSGTYGLGVSPAGSAGLFLASDVNGGYIQAFSGKPLNLNQAGNLVNVLNGLRLGSVTALGATLWSGTGAPTSGLGAVGDIYFRIDTPTTALQRIYIKSTSTVWTGIA